MGLEGLGLAWCKPNINLSNWSIKGVNALEMMAAVTRILGERRYIKISRPYDSEKLMPGYLRTYLKESSQQIECSGEELFRAVQEQVESSDSFEDYLILVAKLNLCCPEGDTIFRCSKCSRKHLYKASGICTSTKCLGKLEAIDRNTDKREQYGGYYAYQVNSDPHGLGIRPYRFHCEELTAQTASGGTSEPSAVVPRDYS